MRREPRRALPGDLLERMVRIALPHDRVVEAHPMVEGLRNSNFQVRLDCLREPVVLRIYEHDASLCRKETDLLRFLRETVPVPEVIHAEPTASGDLPPFVVMRYVEGITFRELKHSGDTEAIGHAARSVGEALAKIHRVTFGKPGWLGPGLTVTAPLLEGLNPMARFVDRCLESANLRARLPASVRDRVHGALWWSAPELAALEDQANLVHSDFNKRNVLVQRAGDRWTVAAILDWEFAVSGTPLADFGNFLRYERDSRPLAEPHFSCGYRRAGGSLPEDWRRRSRLADLVALCASLAQEWLPPSAEAELVELVEATVTPPHCPA